MNAIRTPAHIPALRGRLAVGLLSIAALAACGDDAKKTVSDVPETINSETTAETGPDTPAANRVLEFDQAFGDDNQACKTKPRCNIFLSFTEQRTLKMLYTEDGVAVSGQVVKFLIENDNNSIGFLSSLQTETGPDGLAQITTKAKQSVTGQFAVKVYIDGAPEIPVKYFDVSVSPKGQVPLTVVANYNGTRPVGDYSVNLYKQNAQGQPACQDIGKLMSDETANQSRDHILLAGGTAKFQQFDGLETDGTQKYTIFAFSKNSHYAIQAWVCDATQGVVEAGKSKTVHVTLVDRPPTYKGAYDVVSQFDFVSAIPEPYRTYVNYVVGFFKSPTETILRIACDLIPRNCANATDTSCTSDGDCGGGDHCLENSFCDMMYDDAAHTQPSVLAGFVTDLLNAVIDGFANGSVFGTILSTGGDVADILKAFEMRATFTFRNEPDEFGKFAAGDANENWHTLKVKWTLGADCDPNTEVGCGVKQYSTNAFSTQAITGDFSASVANYYDLTIDMHSLNLNYGALINFFLEKVLLPLVTSSESVDSYEALLGYLVGGGADCLSPGIDELDCCGRLADKAGSGTGANNGKVDGGVEGALNAACNTIIAAGPAFLRQKLASLGLGSGDAFTLGTKAPCKLSDNNGNLIVQTWGPQANPCIWDVRLKFTDTATTTLDSKFWGVRAE